MAADANSLDSGRSYRRDYSLEEINGLLSDIEATLSAYKADLRGIDPDNMVKTVRGGHVIWITVDEMNDTLARRRRVTKIENIPGKFRANRVVAEEMNSRMDACRQLLEILRKASPDSAAEIIQFGRRLEVVHNRADTLTRDIRLLEAAIERKRKEDPILQEMEEATLQMMVSLENNDLTEAERQQTFCDRHLQEFESKQKRLEPYLRKAEEYRSSNLQNKQQLFVYEFEIIEFGVARLLRSFNENSSWESGDEGIHSMIEEAKSLQQAVEEAKPSFASLKELSLAELNRQKDLFERMDRQFLLSLYERIVLLIRKYQDLDPAIGDDTPGRGGIKRIGNRSAPGMIFRKKNVSE